MNCLTFLEELEIVIKNVVQARIRPCYIDFFFFEIMVFLVWGFKFALKYIFEKKCRKEFVGINDIFLIKCFKKC